MTCTMRSSSATGRPRMLAKEEALAYRGSGLRLDPCRERRRRRTLPESMSADIPDVAANALVATETRPRCDRIEEGAIVNMRGPAAVETEDSDRLVSIRMWARRRQGRFGDSPAARRDRAR